MTAQAADVRLQVDDESAAAPPAAGRHLTDLLIGVALLVAGIALIVVGTTVLAHGVVMAARVVLTLAGVAVAWIGALRAGRGLWGRTWDGPVWLALSWVVIIAGCAVLAPLLPIGEASDPAKTLNVDPMLRPQFFSDHPFGTNSLGLDVLARVIYGARVSLFVAFVSVAVGLIIGGLLGIAAGYLRGWAEAVITTLTNAVLAFPALVLLLALAAVLPRSVLNEALIFGALSIPFNIRLARANAIAFTQRDFVTAARTSGAGRARIMRRELLPNVMVPLSSYALIAVAVVMVADASLSFLGLGLPAPKPSWGNMIAEGQNGVFEENPSIVLVPATILFLTVFSFNVLGNRMRERFSGQGVRL